MSKKVAVIYDCAYPFVEGGGQKRLYEVVSRLQAQGWQVDWYCLKAWDGPDVLTQNNIRYIAVGPNVELYRADGKRGIGSALKFSLHMLKVFGLRQYDVIHVGQWPMLPVVFARLYTLFSKTKIIVDWWEVWGQTWFSVYGKKGILGWLLERGAVKFAHDIVAISPGGQAALCAIGAKPTHVHLIHNGIDYPLIQSVKAAKQSFDVVYLGRLKEHKHVDHIVRAAALLREQGKPISVAIIGDGPERASLEALAKTLGVAQDLTFFGRIESEAEAFAVMKGSTCFVHPSTKEGGGSITLFEANGCGLPVIAYTCKHGIDPKLIIEGQNGFWVDVVSPEALATKMSDVLSLPKKNLKTQAEQFAAEVDWGTIARHYNELYNA